MYVMYEKDKMRFPVRVWLKDSSELEKNCKEQAYHLSQLPFLHKWVSLMPDTHAGMGMPIGGVIATEGVVIPNAVGVDIGCGMAYTQTNIKVGSIKEIMTGNGSLIQAMIGDIMRNIPVGFAHHKLEMPCYTMENAYNELERYEEDEELLGQLEAGFYQIGTLGGGNHFIELQEDNEGYLCVMLHSGSRHIGKSVCDYFHKKARELNRKWYSDVPDEYRLAFLPVDSHEGKQYLNWMHLSMDFAKENREKMMLAVKAVLEKDGCARGNEPAPAPAGPRACGLGYAVNLLMDLMPAKYYKKITIKDGEIGLLYYDNRYEKPYCPGKSGKS